jgi:peptidoglycan/LPS O-acetylase OafA/YrhL
MPRYQLPNYEKMVVTNSHWSKTIPSLNGLRAVSVLLVVSAHAGLSELIPGGLGVTIFFFLSGYLITTLLLAEHDQTGEISIRNFYTRRILRLAPPLLITLAIAYVFTYFGLLQGRITLPALLAQLLYFANYYIVFFDPNAQSMPGGTGILWSLAVEEHFYIFFPLLMTVFMRSARRTMAIGVLLVAACLAVLVWRIHLVESPGFFSDRTYLASDTRIDSIIYGCLMALFLNPVRSVRSRTNMSKGEWGVFAAGVGCFFLALLYRSPFFRETFRYSLQGIALFPIFFFAIKYHDTLLFRPLNTPWVNKIGVFSYAIYLIHQVVMMTAENNVPVIRTHTVYIFATTISISILYAALIDKFVDRYFLRLRRRYRSGTETSTAAIVQQKLPLDQPSYFG